MQRINSLAKEVRTTVCNFTYVSLLARLCATRSLLVNHFGSHVWTVAKLALLVLEVCIVCGVWAS